MIALSACSESKPYHIEKLWLQNVGIQQHEVNIVTKRPINISPVASQVFSTLNDIDSIYINIDGDADLRDGFEISQPHERRIDINVRASAGVIYAAFYLQRIQMLGAVPQFPIREVPSYDLRMLDHWDNLDGTVDRGYAGRSIWNWNSLPDTASTLIVDYATFNASLGINAVVINNVSATPEILDEEHLTKAATIAKIFSYYGIRIFFSVNFATPKALGFTTTADPKDENVRKWWRDKVAEIKELMPNFGGFVVKADSEGQPGPLTYGRSYADGANMLAEALEPIHGVVIWRTFVYEQNDEDRATQPFSVLSLINCESKAIRSMSSPSRNSSNTFSDISTKFRPTASSACIGKTSPSTCWNNWRPSVTFPASIRPEASAVCLMSIR